MISMVRMVKGKRPVGAGRGRGVSVLLTLLCFFSSCRVYDFEKELSPKYREFISQVRYIITRQEKDAFINLPDAKKDPFIEEFWAKRNPDPQSQENEFKIEYFNRIAKANELFKSESQPGWLTDRGRIHILYGPPSERKVSPRSDGFRKSCQELWYYGAYFLTFVDSGCLGKYILTTMDLASIANLNINRTLGGRQMRPDKSSFDLQFSQRIIADEPDRIEGVFTLEIPYEGIWFSAEGSIFKTTLDVEIGLAEGRTALDWQFKQPLEISQSASELKENRKKPYRIEIPFRLSQNLDALRKGKIKVLVILKNKTGGESVRKAFDFIGGKNPSRP